MSYNVNSFKSKFAEVEAWLAKEFSAIRTGRATPSLLDSVRVVSYGAQSPLSHVANISSEDAKTLMVAPWDKGQIKAIETAIAQANLGVSAVSGAAGIRVSFPDLTSERRAILVKLVGEKLEHAKVSVRKDRQAAIEEVEKEEKVKAISEDVKFRIKDELQKMVDDGIKKLEAAAETKKKEINS